jgi:hypothetical protein
MEGDVSHDGSSSRGLFQLETKTSDLLPPAAKAVRAAAADSDHRGNTFVLNSA